MRNRAKTWGLTGLVLMILVLTTVCTGCAAHSETRERVRKIDSDPSYHLIVPVKNGKPTAGISFSLPFYRICSKEDRLTDQEEQEDSWEFMVGDGARLEGENVDKLKGMTISISQRPLRQVARNKVRYTEDLMESYRDRYGGEADQAGLRKVIGTYYEKGYLISANASFDGALGEDVVIRSVHIRDLDFHFSFDDFRLSTKQMEHGETDLWNVIDYSSYGGVFVDDHLAPLGYFHLAGKALCNVKKMRLLSLDEDCRVIDGDNFRSLSEHKALDGLGQPSYIDSLKKGQEVDQDYYYLCEKTDRDATVTSLAFVTEDEHGIRRWRLIYQPSVIAGEYLLVNAL